MVETFWKFFKVWKSLIGRKKRSGSSDSSGTMNDEFRQDEFFFRMLIVGAQMSQPNELGNRTGLVRHTVIWPRLELEVNQFSSFSRTFSGNDQNSFARVLLLVDVLESYFERRKMNFRGSVLRVVWRTSGKTCFQVFKSLENLIEMSL